MPLDLVAIRRDLHRHPEVALNEFRTATEIESILKSLGLSPRRVANTGVVADIKGTLPGPVIALRADIDALPIHEQSGAEYASTHSGMMHACGHDTHTTVLLGAAERLMAVRSRLRGGVRLLFQPAEETTQGARLMIDEGVCDGVSAIVGLHNMPSLPVGQAAFRVGPLMASSDRITVHINGVGGHAASPHLAADPLVAGAAVLSGVQAVVSRAISPLEPVVVTIGHFEGGATFNVIPDHAYMEGTVRCFSSELRDTMPDLLRTAIQGIASGHRCTAELEYERMVPAVDNDVRITELARRVSQRLLGDANVTEAQPTMGAEDFALYQEQVPGCFFWLGSGGPHGWHHPAFTVDERMLPLGAELLAEMACQVAGEL